MKRILLLEDQVDRQANINIENYNFIDNILGTQKCKEFLDNFVDNKSKLEIYDTIIIHESIYDEKNELIFKLLDDICKDKYLIKFSGNHSHFSIKNQFYLEVNPSLLYTNIETFLEAYQNNTSNILMFALGEYWELNALLNALEKLNVFIEDNTKKSINKSIFSGKAGLTKIKEISPQIYSLLFNKVSSNSISIEQMQDIAENLKTMIQEKINE